MIWLAAAMLCADPVASVWIRSAGTGALRPEVHAVEIDDREVVVRSAGVSTLFLGALQARPADAETARQFAFRIPRAAPSRPAGQAAGGVFANGVPFYPLAATSASYRDAGLWRFDAVKGAPMPELLANLLADGSRHSPILGYTLQGSPVYGPWGFGPKGLRRMRSSYRLRPDRRRDRWPNGVELTPAQEGPAVDARFPSGTFHEDYAYAKDSGDLDEWNGRFARTPEYPEGVYAHFLSTDEGGALAYPYLPARPFADRAVADARFTQISPRAGEEALLEWAFAAADGSLTGRLENVHERPLHLMIVSADLAEFEHVHPQLTPRGTYAVRHRFRRAVRYALYADFTAPGSAQRVARAAVTATRGDRPPAPPGRAAPSDALRVRLRTSEAPRAGRDLELRFEMSRTDLDPYLGAWGHFAIVDERQRVFIHAHPREEGPATHDHAKLSGPSPSVVTVPVTFPEAGAHKLWAQFQRGGEVLVFPFDLRVAAGPSAAARSRRRPPAGAVRVDITPAGFVPARVSAPAGAKTLKLAFVRSAAEANCGRKVVFPELGIEAALQPGGMWVVDVPLRGGAGVSFACGMGMYRGAIVSVREE